MHKKLVSKPLALITIALFIGMSAIPIAGEIQKEEFTVKENTSFGLLNRGDNCTAHLWGQPGKDGWFIDNVLIWFQYKEVVDKIWYSITEDTIPDWEIIPDDSFYFEQEGKWVFQYKWVDFNGTETMGETIPLALDKSPPDITLDKKFQRLRKRIVFTANTKDDHSEIERVEFWIDGNLEANISNGDYEYIINWEKGDDPVDVKAIAYNKAGIPNEDNSSTTSLSYPYTHTLINIILQKIQTINLFLFQLLKNIIFVP
jgi:hypothetical protein